MNRSYNWRQEMTLMRQNIRENGRRSRESVEIRFGWESEENIWECHVMWRPWVGVKFDGR